MEQGSSQTVTTEQHSSDKPSPKNNAKSLKQLWSSRKLWMTLIAFTLNWLAYWREVAYLHSFVQPEQIAAFSAITRDFHWVIALGLGAYLGVQGAVEWKHGTTSILNQAVSAITEKKDQDIHLVEEGIGNAPALKPFSQAAIHPDGVDDGK